MDLLTDFEFADIPADVSPPASDVEYPCEVCGQESGPYGGRGRKPTKCAEHKKPVAKSSRGPRVTGSNAILATQATEALCQMNGIMALGAMVVGFTGTASAINDFQDAFRQTTYNALLTDPDMCRFILKGGTKSGKLALGISYGMMAMAVGPVAVMEYKDKRAAKQAEALQEERLF